MAASILACLVLCISSSVDTEGLWWLDLLLQKLISTLNNVPAVTLQVNDKGDGFQYIALATKNVFKTAESIKQAHAPIVHDVGYFPGTAITSVVTQDPSGWKFVFLQEEEYLKEIAQRQHMR